jgi:transposase InsO family protein
LPEIRGLSQSRKLFRRPIASPQIPGQRFAFGDILPHPAGQARSILARWVSDYNTKRPHSSPGYATQVAFAAELERRRAD